MPPDSTTSPQGEPALSGAPAQPGGPPPSIQHGHGWSTPTAQPHADAVPVAFDALRPLTSIGAGFYVVFTTLVTVFVREETGPVLPFALGLITATLLLLRVLLATRWQDQLRRAALAVIATLALAAGAIPVTFMFVLERPYPGVGMTLIIVSIAVLIHHRWLALCLIAACNLGWLSAAAGVGIPIPWDLFAVELGMINVAATILHLASTATVRRLAEAQAAIAHVANTDGLTGAANTHRIYAEGQARLDRAALDGLPSSLLYVDMDDLKSFNDAGGHRAGDRALQQLTSILQTCVRRDDLVGRIGGDEFVVMCHGFNSSMAEQLRQRILIQLDTQGLGASIGIATSAPAELDFDTLLDHADAAMYRDKSARRPDPSDGA